MCGLCPLSLQHPLLVAVGARLWLGDGRNPGGSAGEEGIAAISQAFSGSGQQQRNERVVNCSGLGKNRGVEEGARGRRSSVP